MKRRAVTWWVFGACVLLAVQGLAWMSWQVLRLEARERGARAQSERQQAERLCLWRMDSLVAPIVAGEAQRPYFEYRAVLPSGRPYGRMWEPVGAGEAVVASPLLGARLGAGGLDEGLIRLYFQVEPDGRVISPEAPGEGQLMRLLASDPFGAPDQAAVAHAKGRMAELTGWFGGAIAGRDEAKSATDFADRSNERVLEQVGQGVGGVGKDANGAGRKLSKSGAEFEARRQVADYAQKVNRSRVAAAVSVPELESDKLKISVNTDGDQPKVEFSSNDMHLLADSVTIDPAEFHVKKEQNRTDAGRGAAAATPIVIGAFEPRWVGGEGRDAVLVLVRTVTVDGRLYRQGVQLDWAKLRATLLGLVHDLAPDGRLVPVVDAGGAVSEIDAATRMATIPARFELGGEPARAALGMTPARWSLLVTWLAVAAAIAAIGVVLRAAIRLGERRGRFVSAVTHELRTPLTTFQLYSQMLADGMVTDEAVRGEYLQTLKSESGRLAGIVENVLAYARLNRAGEGKTPRSERISPGELLARVRPILNRRCEQSGMDLVVSDETDAGDARALMVDPSSVERILMNLVENACKYAPPGEGEGDGETRVHLDVGTSGDEIEFLVADYGAGIAPGERGRVFGEFVRGGAGQRADRSGLGLGLALSRALARHEGGDLRLVRRRGHGAEFLLVLPLR